MTPNDDLGDLVRDGAPTAFAPGFADRVMTRIEGSAKDPALRQSAAVQRGFLRLVPLALAASLLLAGFNWLARGSDQSPLDAALGLPAVTLTAAYSLGVTP